MKNKHRIKYLFYTFLLILIHACNSPKKEKQSIEPKKDSLLIWMQKAKDSKNLLSIQKQYLDKSYNYLLSHKIDSVSLKKLSDLAYQSFKTNDTAVFKKRNEKVIQLALKIKDSFSLGDAHWNYATFYNRVKDYENSYFHFNEAEKYFKGYEYYVGKMLVGKSFIKNRFSDYIGSELEIIKAVKIFKKNKKYNDLLDCYAALGVIQYELKFYKKALFYYDKALEYAAMSKNKNKLSLNNNIGLLYLKKGDYSKAIFFLKKDLTPNLEKENPRKYARVIDNIAYAKLRNKDTLGIKETLFAALLIRDHLKNKLGTTISKIHLSEYYSYKKDINPAKKYALDANQIAKEVKNSDNYLTTLKMLSSLDPKNSKYYLETYISYSDSIQNLQRNYQNKFARISYDTDEYIEETERLSQQKLWITSVAVSLILILILFYFLRVQKIKNENLLLETAQQQSNEQVYLLTLNQQSKLEEEKVKERNRISEELHDGILGRLFGTRIGLGFIKVNPEEKNNEKYQLFLNELQNIEKEIRKVSHQLSDNFDGSEVNFTSLIKQLILNKSEVVNFKYEIDFDENINWYHFDAIVKVNLYRIIQEAIQNIIKHADAKNVSINFHLNNNTLILCIEDDGVGFDLKKKRNGIGLKNIKSRVKKLNGVCFVSSALNKGTKIKIEIPIPKKRWKEKKL
ncbi:MAG: two-component system NarL family sensor kinase [Polaribacter sp.]